MHCWCSWSTQQSLERRAEVDFCTSGIRSLCCSSRKPLSEVGHLHNATEILPTVEIIKQERCNKCVYVNLTHTAHISTKTATNWPTSFARFMNTQFLNGLQQSREHLQSSTIFFVEKLKLLLIYSYSRLTEQPLICILQPKFHLARHVSTWHHAFWLSEACQTAWLDTLDATRSTCRARMAQHVRNNERNSLLCNLYEVIICKLFTNLFEYTFI